MFSLHIRGGVIQGIYRTDFSRGQPRAAGKDSGNPAHSSKYRYIHMIYIPICPRMGKLYWYSRSRCQKIRSRPFHVWCGSPLLPQLYTPVTQASTPTGILLPPHVRQQERERDMDFLKSAVASAISKGPPFPYTFGDRVDVDNSIWSLYNGTKRVSLQSPPFPTLSQPIHKTQD
jgi:hypothetical protein